MGFYEKLGVPPDASQEEVRKGYHRQLAELVRRMRRAREVGADAAALEAMRDELQDAYDVISDPARRRVYDGFVALDALEDLPDELEGFWSRVRDSVAEPAAAAAVDLVRALTALPVGESLEVARPEAPRVVAAQLQPAMSMQPNAARPNAARPGAPQPNAARPAAPAAGAVPQARLPAPPPQGAPPAALPGVGPAVAPPAPPLSADPHTAGPPTDPLAVPLPGPAAGPRSPGAIDLGPEYAPAAPDAPVLDLDRLAGTYGYDGRYLGAVRQIRGVTLEELAAETQIALRYLEAIEINDYARLPAAVFVRGYLRELTDVLELDDPDALVEGYMKRYARYRGE